MSKQQISSYKARGALRALERPLLGVAPLVASTMLGPREGPVAKRASVFFDWSVHDMIFGIRTRKKTCKKTWYQSGVSDELYCGRVSCVSLVSSTSRTRV